MNNLNSIFLSSVIMVSIQTVIGAAATSLAHPMNPTLIAGSPARGTAVTPEAPAKTVPAYESYSYYGEKYRDPFVPLVGDTHTDQSADRPPAIPSLMLKGIVQDANGRVALLTSGVSSYILRGGRLYDGRNHMVKKISGVIKTDSVVIIGSDRTIREIRTKTTL